MKQLIITIHGIRTFGRWQERLEHLLVSSAKDGRKLTVLNYKYGYFSLFAFLIPPLRARVTSRFRGAMQEAVKGESWDRIDIVAHSFGTQIAAWAITALPSDDSLQIHTIVLAGSVLQPDFRWFNLLRDRIRRVVNDCGYLDWTLLLNTFVLFTGTAGLVGFRGLTSEQLRNRYFPFGHSGFFERKDGTPTDEFMSEHWLPLLLDAGTIPQFDCRPSTFRSGLLAFALNNLAPVKVFFYLSILMAGMGIADSVKGAIASGRHAAATNAHQIAKERLSQGRVPESVAFLAQAVANQPSQTKWMRDLAVILSSETWFLPSQYVPPSCQQTSLGCRRAVVKRESDGLTRVWLTEGVSNDRIGALFQTGEKVDSVFLSPSGSRLIIFEARRIVFFDPIERRIVRTVVNEPYDRDFIDPTEPFTLYGTGTIVGSRAVVDADASAWKSDVSLVGMSEDGTFAAFYSAGNLYLTREGCELYESVLSIRDTDYVTHVWLSTASSVVLIATEDSVRFVDLDTGAALREPTRFEDATSAVFSPDGLRAMVSSAQAAQLFSAKSGEPLSLRWSTANKITSLGFSPDGSAWLVERSSVSAQQVWEARTAKAISKNDILTNENTYTKADAALLSRIASAVSCTDIDAEGSSSPRSDCASGIETIRKELNESSVTSTATRFSRWLLSNPWTRTLSPFDGPSVSVFLNDDGNRSAAHKVFEGNPNLLRQTRSTQLTPPAFWDRPVEFRLPDGLLRCWGYGVELLRLNGEADFVEFRTPLDPEPKCKNVETTSDGKLVLVERDAGSAGTSQIVSRYELVAIVVRPTHLKVARTITLFEGEVADGQQARYSYRRRADACRGLQLEVWNPISKPARQTYYIPSS